MPKGKVPSLIGGSLGKPVSVDAGRKCKCSRGQTDIVKSEKCYDVPQPKKAFSSKRRFCANCFKQVIEQSQKDLNNLQTL